MNPDRSETAPLDWGTAIEDASPARAWLAGRDGVVGQWIDGAWVVPAGAEVGAVIDRTTGRPLAQVALGRVEVVTQAVAAAARAAPSWLALGGVERIRRVGTLARTLEADHRIPLLETLESGRSIRRTRADLALAAARLRIQSATDEIDSVEPGVVGIFLASDRGLVRAAASIGCGLARGCTVVLAPLDASALAGSLFAEVSGAAGIPPGVLNVLTGDAATGLALARHRGLAVLFGSGSAVSADAIQRVAAEAAAPRGFELDSVPTVLVLEDADVAAAADGLIDLAITHAPRVPRVLVQEPVATRFERAVRAGFERVRTGSALDRAADSMLPLDPAALSFDSFGTVAEALELLGGRAQAVSVWTENVGIALDLSRRGPADRISINRAAELDPFGGAAELARLLSFQQAVARARLASPASGDGVGSGGRAASGPLARLWIRGRAVDAEGGADYDAGGRRASLGGVADLRRAIEAARAAAPGWRAHHPLDRSRALERGVEAIDSDTRLGDSRRPRPEVVGVALGAAIRLVAIARGGHGTVRSGPDGLIRLEIDEPLGVIGILAPETPAWLPTLVATVAALAAGNAVVLVPSERGPFPSLSWAQALDSAGLPPGAFNVIAGRTSELAPALGSSAGLEGIWSFGSEADNALVRDRAAHHSARLVVEPGDRLDWAAPALARGLLRAARSIRTVRISA